MRSQKPNQPALDAAAVVRAAARSHDYDRYLAALLANEPGRSRLLALAALAGEIGHVSEVVREPMMGEIRLSWWREAIERSFAGEPSGHPVVEALAVARREAALPPALILGLIDAHGFDFSGEPMADAPQLKSYLARTEGALFSLGARALGAPYSAPVERAATAAGQAYGLVRLLLRLPRDLAQGRVLIPATDLIRHGIDPHDLIAGEAGQALSPLIAEMAGTALAELNTARLALRSAPATIRPAFLPLALVAPSLAAFRRNADTLLPQGAELLPLRRLWQVWRAHITGRV